MYWDVKTVKPKPDYKLYVELEDGRKGIFDARPYLDKGVFREYVSASRQIRQGVGPDTRTGSPKFFRYMNAGTSVISIRSISCSAPLPGPTNRTLPRKP